MYEVTTLRPFTARLTPERCDCDEGYSGYDCSERICPTGDDPGSWDQESEIQGVS